MGLGCSDLRTLEKSRSLGGAKKRKHVVGAKATGEEIFERLKWKTWLLKSSYNRVGC
jgi:hypothetical protein